MSLSVEKRCENERSINRSIDAPNPNFTFIRHNKEDFLHTCRGPKWGRVVVRRGINRGWEFSEEFLDWVSRGQRTGENRPKNTNCASWLTPLRETRLCNSIGYRCSFSRHTHKRKIKIENEKIKLKFTHRWNATVDYEALAQLLFN